VYRMTFVGRWSKLWHLAQGRRPRRRRSTLTTADARQRRVGETGRPCRVRPTLFDAVVSAIEAVESVGGLEVLHVSPDELAWASEIAQRTGRTRQSIDQLIKAKRAPAGFPAPASHSA